MITISHAKSATLFLAALIGATCAARSVADEQSTGRDSDTVRVGAVAFDEFSEGRDHFLRVLREIAKAGNPPMRFEIALGTYGDVEHWMARGMIDLALVTPGLFTASPARPMRKSTQSSISESQSATSTELFDGQVRYLATLSVPAATSPWATAARREARSHDKVRSVALVRQDSVIHSIEDIERAARRDRLRLLLVHPLSVSGCIAPRFALKQHGIKLSPEHIEYTYSHSASVRALLDDASNREDRETVAFVWDDAPLPDPAAAGRLRAIRFPELDSLAIPQDMVVARKDFSRAVEIRERLLAHQDPESRLRFIVPSDWPALHREVVRWRSAVEGANGQNQGITLNEIGRLLVHYARTQPRPVRLALVFSGGGAKCSYQVGAVGALEEMLADLRAANSDVPLDIDLVVGTSGGAINALPVALGITRSAIGREQFGDVWISLDQRDIVRPSWVVRASIGLWFALLDVAVVLALVRLLVRDNARRGWWFGGIFTTLGAVQLAIAYTEPNPWRLLGTNHWAHHVWLWLSFGARASAWSLLVLGICILFAQAARRRRGTFLAAPRRGTAVVLAVSLIGLPLAQLVNVLFVQLTLSGGEGMQHALATHYPALIDGELVRRALPPLEVNDGDDDAQRLQTVGRQVVERQLLARDLVITGSRLKPAHESDDVLPSDLYFYLQGYRTGGDGAVCAEPPLGRRGIALAERPELTLDVVLGSGSIFPVFPARRLRDFPVAGTDMELVDGGFAHNSPIEAAVLWGATHIVLIEASPQVRLERTNFATNAAASFDHLYEQSQLLDARSRGKVAVFTLAPEPPHLCVLDFADNLIEDSIERGYRDASGHGPSMDADATKPRPAGTPRFRKELGEPVFVQLE